MLSGCFSLRCKPAANAGVNKCIGHPLLNAPLKKPEKFKVNFSTIYVILMKIMKGVEINA
jgi:hypothetical protein